MPVLFTMWDVIVFIRFSIIVGYAGVAMSLGFIFLASLCQTLTTLSLVAVISNNDKVTDLFSVFSRSLGESIAATICLLYFVGMVFLSTLELTGSVQAVHYIMVANPKIPDSFTYSPYTDQLCLAIPSLVVLLALRAYSTKITGRIAIVVILSVLCALFLGILGLFLTAGGWKVDESDFINTGISVENLRNNMFPDWSVPASADPDSVVASPSVALGLIYPSFLGVFQGANKASELKTPQESIIKGTLSAVAISTVVYVMLVVLLGAVTDRDSLKADPLLFPRVVWPTEWIGLVGTVMVGVGACLALLEIAPTILASVAKRDVVAVLGPRGMHLHRMSGGRASSSHLGGGDDDVLPRLCGIGIL